MNVSFKFIKSLKVLIVEDEELAGEKLKKHLSRIFKEVVLENNGVKGFLTFQKAYLTNNKFDLIISDINMPKMDGLEMLENIRVEDKDIPFIFLTARNEPENILKAIDLNVSFYVMKPIDLDELTNKINRVCEELYYRKSFENQKDEMEKFIDIINQSTIVTKTDTKGFITYTNEAFCKLSGYTEEELIGQPHNIVRHPDVPSSVYKEMWNTIREGKIWKGTLKNKAKNGDVFYNKTRIIPIIDANENNIIEYMGVRFSKTDEELQSIEFKKKVRSSIQDFRQKEIELNKKISDLELKMSTGSNDRRVLNLNTELNNLNIKNKKLTAQNQNLEDRIKKLDNNNYELVKNTNEKVKNYSDLALEATKKDKEKSLKIENLSKEVEEKNRVISAFQKAEEVKNKKIRDLEDVILSYEEKYGVKNLK